MAKLSIPERYQGGVSRISKLDIETVRAIRRAFDEVISRDPAAKPTSAAISAIGSVSPPETTKGEYRKIAEALASMSAVQSGEDMSVDEFVDEIASALEVVPNVELRLAANEKESFKEKLAVLLGAEVFGIVSKVSDLQREGDHVFCTARILTDVRPVFGSKIENGPVAALVLHNLKIAYHGSGGRGDHDFYVLLDADDLSELKEAITRAEAKAKTLRDMINSNIRIFGESQ